jgi:hypothetical protein
MELDFCVEPMLRSKVIEVKGFFFASRIKTLPISNGSDKGVSKEPTIVIVCEMLSRVNGLGRCFC